MSDSGPGRREVAYRLFAAEFDDAEFSYSESDEERAPNFVVTPTGARVNRLFAVGVLTEVEDVNPEMVRGRVVDPTGAFVTYAGQYQPDELAFLERTDPPTFLALSGKARTFEPDDGDRVYTSVRPESVSEVDAETRDRWVVTAAERTLERVGIVASAIESGLEGDRLRVALEAADVDERLADGVALALDYYGTTPAYLEALRETAIEAVEVVAGERDEVSQLDVAPGEGMGDAAPLATLELEEPDVPEPESVEPEGEADAGGATTESPTTADPDVEAGTDAETGTTAAAGEEPDATTDTGDEPETGAVSGTDPTPEDAGGADVEAGAGGSTDEGDLEPEGATEAATDPEPEVSPDASASETTAESVEGAGQAPGDDDEDFDPGEFDLDEEERREVEEEYGTEFSTADEVESPEETEESGADDEPDDGGGSETPTEAEMAESAPGEEAEASADTADDSEPETETAATAETDGEESADGAEATAADESASEGAAGEPAGEEATEEPAGEEDPAAEPAADDGATGDDAADADVDLEDAVMSTMEALDDGDGADQEELVSTVAEEHGADPGAVEEAIQDALMSGRCYEPADGVLKSI